MTQVKARSAPQAASAQAGDTLVEIRNLEKHFPLSGDFLEQLRFKGGKLVRRQEFVHAINGVDIDVRRGESLCVVGESGCGKSTVARMVMGLLRPSGGEIRYDGERIDHLSPRQLLPYRRRMQMIFQNPYASLNPRMTIQQTLEEPLRFHHPDWKTPQIRDKVAEVMDSVGIDPEWGRRFGHEFSGGQRQRIAIARALAVDPEFIVADEPTTALDVTIQAEIMSLLLELCEKHNVALVLITHDLGVVSQVTQRTLVMYAGRVIEQGPTREIINDAQHPYTQGLINALPQMATPGSRLNQIPGAMPTLAKIPPGCAFHPRCSFAFNDDGSPRRDCREVIPGFVRSGNCDVACHMVRDLVENDSDARDPVEIQEAP